MVITEEAKIRDQHIGKFFNSQGNGEPKSPDFDKLPASAKLHIKSFKDANVENSVDVGCGAGDILLGLQETGIKMVYGVDLSPKSITMAKLRIEKFGKIDNAEFYEGSFVDMDSIQAESVSYHKTLCCHPDLELMLNQAINMNTRIIAITVPRRRIFVKLGLTICSGLLKIIRNKYRPHLHREEKIDSILSNSGYMKTVTKKYRIWQTSIYEKNLKST
ncbi:MAG: class I SAM-dependent methyltransferase [Candidatus Heimdallarchaeota archaeon]|nr:class I SAM-dependent methyltransferase [Candidatus Heimdallarchaeota archaeon]